MARLEIELSKHPESRGISSNIISLRRLQSDLGRDFEHTADAMGLDVLHYRILDEQPTAKSFASSVGTFQDALTVAYDALRNGPKLRRTTNPLATADTELRVAYSYPGSFGVVFTVSNERFLLPEIQSYFDRATETVVNIGKA